MTATLTERYVETVIRSLPAPSQADVRAELVASIDDAVEALIEQGHDRVTAERRVLGDMGDPEALAADYAGRPLHLIGPRYYLTWARLLKLLVMIVPACAVGATLLARALEGATFGEMIAESAVVGITVVLHLCFWVTLAFFVLERTGAETGAHWSVEKIPATVSRNTGRVDLIASLVLLGLAAGAIVWDHFRGFALIESEALPMISPQLWPWAISVLFLLLGLEALFAIELYRRGRWSFGLAAAKSVLAVMFMCWALYLIWQGELVNQEFISVLGEHNVDDDTQWVLAVLGQFFVIGIALWAIIDSWLKSARQHRQS